MEYYSVMTINNLKQQVTIWTNFTKEVKHKRGLIIPLKQSTKQAKTIYGARNQG